MKKNIAYEFHHMGIPTTIPQPNERYSAKVKMFTSDNLGHFKIQWHRFEADSPLHPLIKVVPHLAFKVSNLEEAIADEEIILYPYEPIDGFYVAMINNHGVPIELIQTSLSDEDIWALSQAGKGCIYRD